MSEPTLDQKRASHAFGLVQKVKQDFPADPKEAESKELKSLKQFKIQVKKLPARIMTSGLGQSLAFLEAKNYAPHLRAGLADWVDKSGVAGSAPPDRRLLFRVIQGDSDFLRFATAECLAYLHWLVRFTDAEFRDVSEQE
jgi:CRISPR/Cas system CMR-associated protein Cmr5 small subunit